MGRDKTTVFAKPYRFPKERKELLALEKADQDEIVNNFEAIKLIKSKKLQRQKYDQIAQYSYDRALRILQILDKIKQPTAENVGLDGSKAIAVLALHSSLDVMKKILNLFEKNFGKDRNSIYYQAIPPLQDRIMILEKRKQLFGTNWTTNAQGKPFLIEVEDFHHMNQRRAAYGLKAQRRPVDLARGAKKYPLGLGLARKNDQKKLTNEEYESYAHYFLKQLLP